MKYIKKGVLICIISLILTGCVSISPEEKAKANAYAQEYKEKIEQYIKDNFGDDAKILKIYGSTTTHYDALWYVTGKEVANGNVIAEVEQNKQEFKVVYFSETDTFRTNKNKKNIEESLRNYIAEAVGEDNMALRYFVWVNTLIS